MAVILVGILTTKPLIFINVLAGGHKQGRVAQLVLNISSSIKLNLIEKEQKKNWKNDRRISSLMRFIFPVFNSDK
jgi:hypothetical protein